MPNKKYLTLNALIKRAQNRVHQFQNIIEPPKIDGNLPTNFSLQQYNPRVYNQLNIGSCTSNAFCSAFNIMANIQNKYKNFEPSRLFFYYNERDVEDTESTDAGGNVYNGLKYASEHGVCSENKWPYNPYKVTIKPNDRCYKEAEHYKIKSTFYRIVRNSNLLQTIKTLIYQKKPVLVPIQIFTSFENTTTSLSGNVPMPNLQNEQSFGGHEILIVGYDDDKRSFYCVNSWGKSWGLLGYCYLKYDYVMNPQLGIEFTTFEI